MQSLWGAVLGTAVVTFVSELLSRLQIGIHLDGAVLRIPQGTRPVVLGAIMALALVLRPQGLTGGREFLLLSWSQRMLRTPKWPR